MAMTRRYRKKRSSKKRSFNRSYRPRKSSYTRVVRFKSTQFAQSINGNAGGTTQYFGTGFTLSSVPNSASYTGLFDQYRLTKIQVKFIQSFVNVVAAPNSVGQPVMYIVSDMDDATPPTSISQIIEREGARILNFSGAKSVHTHTLTPYVASADLDSSLVLRSSSVRKSPWLNCSYNNISHFGLKYAFDNLPLNAQINLYVTYYFECKNTN